ncbi:MAG: type VI secretion system protein TssA [Proteobacteria bacterium]|nr:type VI secretion system protein TssA [Pseudomonadota bacterium]
MSTYDVETLLQPLPGPAPCGPELDRDPVYAALEAAGNGKPEQEFGDVRIEAVPPDWAGVEEHALALLQRTRDLRVAVWLTRAGARLGGLPAAVQGLKLLLGLLERHWQHVHPQIDEDGDAIARANALAALSDHATGLADFRAARLTADRVTLTVRDIELALGRAQPFGKEAAPTEEGVLVGIAALDRAHPGTAAMMRECCALVAAIALRIEHELGVSSGVDLVPLHRLLKPVDEAARRTLGVAAPASASSAAPEAATGSISVSLQGAIQSRDDVVRALDRACSWMERNEPSHPAPLLLRRAQRLMSKSFVEIVRDIAPKALDELGSVAGERYE